MAEAPDTFTFAKIVFPPSHFLSAAELDALAAPYRGHSVTPADIDRLLAAINALYAGRGIVTARALLPPQQGESGTLTIDLVEGKLGEVRIKDGRRLKPAYLQHQLAIDPGETIDPEALRGALWRFNRLSDVQLHAALSPGKTPGLTDVDLAVTAPRRDQLTLFVDNHAYGATGTYEGGALYRHSGLLGLDDRLSVLATGAQGSLTGTVAYDMPLGYDGTRASISYGRGLTRIVAGNYARYGTKGLADSVTGEVVRPLWNDTRWLILGSASGGYTRTRNYIDGRLLDSTGTTRVGLGLTISYQGTVRALTMGVTGTFAHGEIDNGERRTGHALVTGTLAFTQRLIGPLTFSASGAGQWSNATGLPSDILFQVGGPTTVRGYTQGALAGDKGYYADGQINWTLPAAGSLATTLFAFVDRGHVVASFEEPEGLTSIGGGASFRLGKRLGLDTSLGHPLQNRRFGPGKVHAYARLTWDMF